MHMADALLSPAVGGVMTAVSVVTMSYSVKKITGDKLDEKKIPMMGVMGAFVFAAQMINFTIPGTGSSGHIGGGILLAALLGPFPALLTMASVLLIQCLFFADGGLLAYGCNVFNIGVCACLFGYQFLYKPIILKRGSNKKGIILASMVSAVIGLQIGALFVALETLASGVTELPFRAFVVFMQPIHFAIGLVEGIATAAVLCFVHNARPELFEICVNDRKLGAGVPMKKVLTAFFILTVLAGGGLSLLASPYPDGLEWSVENVAGTAELERDGTIHDALEEVTDQTALMPGYAFAGAEDGSELGTAASGMAGSAITIVIAGGIGFIVHLVRKKTSFEKAPGTES